MRKNLLASESGSLYLFVLCGISILSNIFYYVMGSVGGSFGYVCNENVCKNADHVLVLEGGRISGWGTPDELLKTNKIYQEVYNSQNQGGGEGDFDRKGDEA